MLQKKTNRAKIDNRTDGNVPFDRKPQEKGKNHEIDVFPTANDAVGGMGLHERTGITKVASASVAEASRKQKSSTRFWEKINERTSQLVIARFSLRLCG